MITKIAIPLLLVVLAVYYNESLLQFIVFILNIENNNKSDKVEKPPIKLFTEDELQMYNGKDEPQLYLSILGKIYDVSKGASNYEIGKPYNFFIGRDASRGFVTGKLEKAASEVADLSNEDLLSLNHWIKFYNKEYPRVGKLIGKFYNEAGKLTTYGRKVRKLMKTAEMAKQVKDAEKLNFPPCNVEWDMKRGSHVWCTDKSGGIDRDWVGVPRQLYEPGSKSYRCACVKPEYAHLANLMQYEGCDSESTSCYPKVQ